MATTGGGRDRPAAAAAPAPGRFGAWACLASAALAALAATWPLARALDSAVPRGTELAAPPMLHGVWSLWWAADRALHGLHGFWDAPIFHPLRGAFALVDPMPLLGALSAPLWAVGLPPALCYNLTLLALLAFNGLAAGRLALALGASRTAAALAAALAATLPFAAKMAGVLPVLSFFGLLAALEGLVRFSRSGSRGAALLVAAGLAAQWHSSEQVALLGAPALALALAAALARQRVRARATARLALSLLAAAALALPTALPLLDAHRRLGLARAEADVLLGSARLEDFATRPFTSPLSVPPRESLERDTSGLFPGALSLLLALAGAVAGLRARRPWTGVLVAGAALCGLLALGLNASLVGWRPYALLREAAPGFAGLRSPFRAALLLQALLAVLAAQGFDAALRLRPGRGWRAGVLGAALLAVAENLCAPALLLSVPRDPATPLTAWLRARPTGTAVVHLPLPPGDDVADFRAEAWRMFRQIDHGRPMLNGYAAWFPPHYDRLQRLLNAEFPSRRALCALAREAQVDTVVIDRAWPGASRLAGRPEAAAMLLPAYRDEDALVFLLRPPPGTCDAAD